MPVCLLRDRRVRLYTELTLVRLRNHRRHQLAVPNRPIGWPAHCFLRNGRHRFAIEVSPVLDYFDDVKHWLSRNRSNKRKKCFRSETVAAVENLKAHRHSFPAASSSAAIAASY